QLARQAEGAGRLPAASIRLAIVAEKGSRQQGSLAPHALVERPEIAPQADIHPGFRDRLARGGEKDPGGRLLATRQATPREPAADKGRVLVRLAAQVPQVRTARER